MHEAQSFRQPRDSIRTRLAIQQDVPAIIQLVNAAFLVEDFLEGTRTDEQRMTAMMLKGEFLIAEDESGRLVASVYTECSGEHAYLGMLAVDPSRQGTGLGRSIAEAAEEHCRARGCRHMRITVLSLRSQLLPFYRKLGYAEAGTEPFRPSRPLKAGVECQAIVMRKSL
jgi:GNAT superfamily N-acetyltransferase